METCLFQVGSCKTNGSVHHQPFCNTRQIVLNHCTATKMMLVSAADIDCNTYKTASDLLYSNLPGFHKVEIILFLYHSVEGGSSTLCLIWV